MWEKNISGKKNPSGLYKAVYLGHQYNKHNKNGHHCEGSMKEVFYTLSDEIKKDCQKYGHTFITVDNSEVTKLCKICYYLNTS